MNSRNHSLLVDLAIVLVLALIAIVGYKYSPLLLPTADLSLAPVADCNLNRQTCRVGIPGGGSVDLALTPHPIPVVHPFQVQATLSDMSAEKVEIDFAGITMDMGYNRLPLTRNSSGAYSAQAALPVCITGRMEWRATLLLDDGRRRITIPFLFVAPSGGD